jgi:predicted dehydrogenase
MTVSATTRVGVVGVSSMARAHLDAWRQLGGCTRLYSTGSRAPHVAADYGATLSGAPTT